MDIFKFKRKKKSWDFPKYCEGNSGQWRDLSESCKKRDGYRCTGCGAPGKQIGGHAVLQAHHVVSKSKGGEDRLDNLETVCLACHSKHHRHLR